MTNPHHPKNEPVKNGYFYYLGLGMPTPVFFGVQALMLWAIYHAINTRTVEDYVIYGGIIAVAVLLVSVGIWFKSSGRQISLWKILKLGLLFIIPGAVAVGALYYSLIASAYDLLFWLWGRWNHPYAGPLAVSAAVLFVGIALFWFRMRLRVTYGLTEILVGVSIASYKYIETAQGGGPNAAADANLIIALLTAGVYLVVRGLDNMQQGLKAVPSDPLCQPLINWYRQLGSIAVDVKTGDSSDQVSN